MWLTSSAVEEPALSVFGVHMAAAAAAAAAAIPSKTFANVYQAT